MPEIPYGRHYIDEEDIAAVVAVLRSGRITQGPKVKEFEEALCRYTGAKYAVAVSSGTAALHLACLAAGIKPGDEVITSPVTFLATPNSVLYCGGRPVFADIQEDTVNIDPLEIQKRLTKKTRVLLPVHFAGHPCDLAEIRHIAKAHKLLVIEDACHALGAEYKGSKIGSCKYSDMTVFSFHPVKHITTGEGGAIMTNSKHLYDKLLMLRTHGMVQDSALKRKHGGWFYEMRDLGFNYRITDFQCALGLSQLRKIDDFIHKRRQIVRHYETTLGICPEIQLPVERQQVLCSWHLYPIRVVNPRRRRSVYETLQQAGIGVQVHYIPVHWQPYYRKLGYRKSDCPQAGQFYRAEISIPIYPSLKKAEQDYVIDQIQKAFKVGGA